MWFRRRVDRSEPGRVPAPAPFIAPAPLSEHEHRLILQVMRASPDVRYRAARERGLLRGLDGLAGGELERRLLAGARATGRLAELSEAVAR